ncbi:MAG: hypothetical protein NVSMB21_14900 [Vulcanimicrobiaceae bacterium]
MSDGFSALPAVGARVALTVAIPARDEEDAIGGALLALVGQRDEDGTRLAFDRYETIVFANDCADATVARARALARAHPRFTLHVVAGSLPASAAHVGTARKAVMDVAARRFLRARRPEGTVATTDADTIVSPTWIVETLGEARHADAVMGRIMLAPSERASLSDAARRLYLADMAYRRIASECEAVRDPVDCDPLPRHGQHYGASFAVSARAYVRAGGLPPRPMLEDLAFFEALQRIDARIRHSMRVRVETSARTLARVDGGFATFLGDLHARGARRDEPFVEAAALTLARFDARAALRRLWQGSGTPADLDRITATYGMSRYRFRRLFDCGEPFGANAQRFEANASEAFARVASEPLPVALATLRCALAAAKAARPTRSIAASGAG